MIEILLPPAYRQAGARGGEIFWSFGYLVLGIYLGFGICNLEFETGHFDIILSFWSSALKSFQFQRPIAGSLHRRRFSYPESIHLY